MQQENKLVSIIMAAYNTENYIEKAIESILTQTYNNFELIICDDCSTDKTFEIINKFHDARIKKLKNHSNLGYLETINFLHTQCSGDYIFNQDSDDWSDSTRIEKQMKIFNEFPEVYLVGIYGQLIYSNGKKSIVNIPPAGFISNNLDDFPFIPASIGFKKEVLMKIKGFHPYFNRLTSMDQYFNFKILSNYKGYFLNELLYYANFNPSSNHRTLNNLRKVTAHEAYLLLKKQSLERGTDWLEEGKEELLLEFEYSLMKNRKFMAEKYREYSVYLIDSYKLRQALPLLMNAFTKNPFHLTNYRTLIYLLKRVIKG